MRPACDAAGVLSDEATVGVVGGRFEAFNKNLIVSQPCDLPDFNVSFIDLDFALRQYEDPKVKVTEKSLMLNGKTRVPRSADRVPLKRPEIDTNEIGDVDDLLAVIDEIYPFTEGNPARPWSQGARFDGTTVTATNSIMLIQAELGADSGFEGVTLSRAALSYIRLRRASLKAWAVCDRGLLLDFDDGAWALAAKMSMEMPDQAVMLLQSIDDWDGLVKVDDAYRNAILRAGDWSEDYVVVRPEHIYAGRKVTDHNEPAVTNLGESEEATFEARALSTVITRADRIAFDRFPNPVPFITARGSKGLIAGRT
uniref:Major capsid protein n=1 Tax=Dinoroseobacter phage vB_DshS_R26L TaxID=3161158 RepID=A0AAU7VGR3_9CAUD